MSKLPDLVLKNALGCLCTSDENCNPSGATVFYATSGDKIIFLTHEKSLKAKHIAGNPNVCFVISNLTSYEQLQLYCLAKKVDHPEECIGSIKKVIEEYSKSTKEMVPFMEITNEGGPVVFELTPKDYKHFKSGQGLKVVNNTRT